MQTSLQVVFSVDATGMSQDITEQIILPVGTCLYCLHNQSLLHLLIRDKISEMGYDTRYFFQLMKVYVS